MALRFQLIHDFLGALTIEQADPIGINEITQTVKRSTDNEGVVYEIIFDIDFIKEGREYLKRAFEQYGGIDAEVLVNVYEYDPNLRKWKLYANGRVNFNRYDLYEDKLTVNIEQVGFQRRVMNLLEMDVDVETLVSENGSALPTTSIYDAEYHSKSILRTSEGMPQDSNEAQLLDVHTFEIPYDLSGTSYRSIIMVGSIDTQKTTHEELQEFFKVSYSYLPMISTFGGFNDLNEYTVDLFTYKDNRFPVAVMTEAGNATVTINVNMRHKLETFDTNADVDICGEGSIGNVEILYWYEVRHADDTIFVLSNVVRMAEQPCGTSEFGYIQGTFTDNLDVAIGDKIYFYHTVRIYGDYERPTGGFFNGFVHHNLFIQNSPPKWLATSTYGTGDRVNHLGNVWESLQSSNYNHIPQAGSFWEIAEAWPGMVDSTSIKISSLTTAPTTTSNTVLLYDVALKCCQYVTNQIDCFKSDLLGRTELGYPVDGAGALLAWTNGGWLRKLPNKKLFTNLKQIIDFVDSVFCVGFGFEIVDGRSILRLERREFFYNKNSQVLSVGKVYNIKKRLDVKKFYNQIEYGYIGKIDIGKVNAIDEFNTARKAKTTIVNTKNKLKISTTIRASGYQIENQRRLQFSTADSKLDDENFVIVMVRNGANFKTKKDEGYTSIINVIDVPSGYNYDIHPARCLKNWYTWLASMMVRSVSKKLKFSYGEVNYKMASQQTGELQLLYEDGEFDLTNIEPIFEPLVYEFKAPMTREQFALLKANPYGVIQFEDHLNNKFEGFLSDKGIEHDSFKGMADFELLHVYRI